MQGVVLGEVIESRHSGSTTQWAALVMRLRTAWEEQSSVLDGSRSLLALMRSPADGVPLHQYMATLGPTGMTAWSGLCIEVAQPQSLARPVVVSAAGGAVGTVAGQLAKAEGMSGSSA